MYHIHIFWVQRPKKRKTTTWTNISCNESTFLAKVETFTFSVCMQTFRQVCSKMMSLLTKFARYIQFQKGAESAEQLLFEQQPTTLEGLSPTPLFDLKLQLVMWVLPRQPISMFGILNPSLCGRACIWWSNVTPNLFANAKNTSLTSNHHPTKSWWSIDQSSLPWKCSFNSNARKKTATSRFWIADITL